MDGSFSKEDDDSPDQFLTNPSYHPTNGMITEYSTHSNRDKPASSYRPSDTVLWRATQTHSHQMQGSAYATTQNPASMNPYRPSDTDLWHPATPQMHSNQMQGLAYATTHNPAPMNPHQRPEHLHLSDINVGYPHNNLNYASSHPHTNNARFVSDCDEWYSQSVNTYAQMPRVAHGPTQSTFVSHTNQFANVNQAISQAPPHGYYNPHHHHDRLHH